MAALFPSCILYIRNIKLYSPQPALELDKNTPAGTVTSMRKAFLGVIQVFSITFIVTCLILMSNGINMFPKPGYTSDFQSPSSYSHFSGLFFQIPCDRERQGTFPPIPLRCFSLCLQIMCPLRVMCVVVSACESLSNPSLCLPGSQHAFSTFLLLGNHICFSP